MVFLTRAALALIVLLAGPPAAGEVVLNEVLALNGLSGVDEEGDSEDWIELHNPGGDIVDLAGYTLSDDPLVAARWTFPSVKVPPGGYLRVWMSGKDRFIPPPAVVVGDAGAFAFDPIHIEPEAEWRYLVGDPAISGPPTGWNGLGFDDSGWSLGRAGIGYGDEDDFTDLPVGTTAVFIRRIVAMEDPAKLESLVLQVDFDDGFVAYLNGTRVVTEGFAAGADPSFSSLATVGHEAGTPRRYDLMGHRARLRAGDNVLALAGLNTGATSSDLSLHPQLGAIPLILHAGFKLDAAGERLTLRNAAGVLVDEVIFPEQTEDHSYGRSPDGAGSWAYLLTPTPAAPNRTLTSTVPFSSWVVFDPPAGRYPAALQVEISAQPAGVAEVRYTVDGSEPTPQSSLHAGPITVDRNTVFRAAGFIGGERSTRVLSQSYFLGGSLSLPILSISMDPADYDKVHNDAGATGRTSERPCFLEVFTPEGDLGAATGCGLRLHGGAGRNGDMNTKKAYKCYFRGSYGVPRLLYPLIPDTPVADFDKVVLRSGFNDAFRTNGAAAYLRDQLIRDLHRDMGQLAANGSWCNLYVNMRFRGLYNIAERMDEEFLQAYTGDEAWDVMKTGNDVLHGENTEWERLHDFAIASDLSQDALYAQAEAMVDLENFNSYMILNTWAQNHDWPHNNWYAARRQVPEAKWTFLCWDAEFGIGLIPGGYTADSFQFTLERNGYIRDLFASLLQSPRYRELFAREIDRHLFQALRGASVAAHVDRLREVIAPDMPEEAALHGQTYNLWLQNVATCRTFALARGAAYRNLVLGSTTYGFPAPPRVFACEPGRVLNRGGVVVRLRGVRLRATTAITFDGVPAAAARLVASAPDAVMDVTLPLDLAVGISPAIEVRDPQSGESSIARDLLRVDPPVPVATSLEPSTGDPRGGVTVRIAGEGFLDGAVARFGSAPAAAATRVGGSSSLIEVVSPAGAGEVEVRVANVVKGIELPAEASLRFTYLPPPPRFVRGDANRDGEIDISDPVGVLGYLYLGSGAPGCLDAADGDDSGELDLSDAISVLGFLFTGAAPPPPPHPACAEDPSEDPLGCVREGGC